MIGSEWSSERMTSRPLDRVNLSNEIETINYSEPDLGHVRVRRLSLWNYNTWTVMDSPDNNM